MDWEEVGKRWMEGYPIEEFGDFIFTDPQKQFINNKDKFSLVYGGFASGKTSAFIVKLWMVCAMFPGARVLLGRKTRADIESAILQDIIDIFPEGSYKHKVGPGIIEFPNGSEILFYGLDAMQSGNAQEMKKSIQKIKGLNLTHVFIDQLEEIEYSVWKALTGRLRNNSSPIRQMCATINPANHWSYKFFIKKLDPETGTPLRNVSAIKTSMIDNQKNLPKDFLEDQLSRDEIYKKRYVYGEWDESTMVEGMVFEKGYLDKAEEKIKKPLRVTNDLHIYVEPTNHDYQIGVDPSTGATDPCHIAVVDKLTGEVVATYSGKVPTEVQVRKTLELATLYTRKSEPFVVPEVNGVGQSFIDQFKKVYNNIHIREIFNKRTEQRTQKLGFYTTYQNKQSLIEHFKGLQSKNFPIIYDRGTLEEFRTFIYSSEAKHQGAGAAPNTHDDKVMATLFAFWKVDGQRIPEDAKSQDFEIYGKDYD